MPNGTLNKRYVRTQTLAPDPIDVFALGQIREQFTYDRMRRKPGEGVERGSGVDLIEPSDQSDHPA